MAEFVYRTESSLICGVNIKTWDSYVEKGYIKPDGKDPLGHMYFKKTKVQQFANQLRKDRKNGLPLFIGRPKKKVRK